MRVFVVTGRETEVWGNPPPGVKSDRVEPTVYIESDKEAGVVLDGTLLSEATIEEFTIEEMNYADPQQVGWQFLGLDTDIAESLPMAFGVLSHDSRQVLAKHAVSRFIKFMEKGRVSTLIKNQKLQQRVTELMDEVPESIRAEAKRVEREEIILDLKEYQKSSAALQRGSDYAAGLGRAIYLIEGRDID